MPRPPPHLARRSHGLALAPRPPRRGLPARPLRPDAAAGGESTQSLTLSLGNGCRKVPVAAISPSSRGVPGAVLRPATAPGELWGQPQSARDFGSALPPYTPALPERGFLTFGNPSMSPEPVDDRHTGSRGSDSPALGSSANIPPNRGRTHPLCPARLRAQGGGLNQGYQCWQPGLPAV